MWVISLDVEPSYYSLLSTVSILLILVSWVGTGYKWLWVQDSMCLIGEIWALLLYSIMVFCIWHTLDGFFYSSFKPPVFSVQNVDIIFLKRVSLILGMLADCRVLTWWLQPEALRWWWGVLTFCRKLSWWCCWWVWVVLPPWVSLGVHISMEWPPLGKVGG